MTNPIFLVEIQGDVKHYADALPMVKESDYDKFLNKTFIIVDAPEKRHMENVRNHFYKIHSEIRKQEKQLKTKQIEIKYFEQWSYK